MRIGTTSTDRDVLEHLQHLVPRPDTDLVLRPATWLAGVRAGKTPLSRYFGFIQIYSSTCLKSALMRRKRQDNEHGSRNRQKYQGRREDSHEDLGLEGLRLPVLRRRHRVRTITRGRIVRVVRIRAAPPVRVPAIDHHASRPPSAATVALSRCRR